MNRPLRLLLPVLLALLVAGGLHPARPAERHSHPLLDTVRTRQSSTVARDSLDIATSERNRRLYDSIRTKTSRRAVPRLLYRMLFRRPVVDTLAGRVVDESRALERFAGATVGEIRIVRAPIFGQIGRAHV